MVNKLQGILIFLLIVLGNSIDTSLQVFDIKESSQLSIIVGKSYYLKFRANPSTGYDCYNGTQDFVSDPHPEHYVGVGGYDYFQIKAICSGTVDLEFLYKRSWEQESSSSVKVTLNIEEDD